MTRISVPAVPMGVKLSPGHRADWIDHRMKHQRGGGHQQGIAVRGDFAAAAPATVPPAPGRFSTTNAWPRISANLPATVRVPASGAAGGDAHQQAHRLDRILLSGRSNHPGAASTSSDAWKNLRIVFLLSGWKRPACRHKHYSRLRATEPGHNTAFPQLDLAHGYDLAIGQPRRPTCCKSSNRGSRRFNPS